MRLVFREQANECSTNSAVVGRLDPRKAGMGYGLTPNPGRVSDSTEDPLCMCVARVCVSVFLPLSFLQCQSDVLMVSLRVETNTNRQR